MKFFKNTFKSLFCLFLFLSTFTWTVEQQRSWTPSEMMKLKMIKDVRISPDNKSVLFVVYKALMTADKDTYTSKIYKTSILRNEAPLLITQSGNSNTQPRWSPNGQWIAFLSDLSGCVNLYLISPCGGDPIAITHSKHSVQTFCWSPDSQKIAFVMADEILSEKNQKPKNSSYVYEQDKKINRLWVVDISKKEAQPVPLTSDSYFVRGLGDFGTSNEEFDWSPNGKQITFAYSPSSGFDAYYMDSSLATVNLDSGAITPWEKHAQHESMPRYSPDGKLICYLASGLKANYAFNRRVFIRTSDGKELHKLAPTFNEGPFLGGPNLLGWTDDGNHVLFFEPKRTKFHFVLLPKDGTPAKELATGDWFFKEPSLSLDRKMLGFIAQSSENAPEAYVAKLDPFRPIRISLLNKEFLKFPRIKTEVIRWTSPDGQEIEGLLTYPLGYQKGHHYPLLLIIHGGPMGFFDNSYVGAPNIYPIASFAEAGFMILRPNPRGSCGYGKAFRCMNFGDWGGKDFEDLIAGVDTLTVKGMADPDRLGIMGWSYGGYMTAWAITQTTRFKVASMGAGVSNLVSLSGTTDVHRLISTYLGDFWHNSEIYHQRSPVYHVTKVTTPCLIQHGLEDKRVPVSQAYEFYHALKKENKQVKLELYPRMEHRFNEPKLFLDVMEKNLAWFRDHLLKPVRNKQQNNSQ
jgi:dipeptidyl aminopeptidase/acylaminoacyl peptidase